MKLYVWALIALLAAAGIFLRLQRSATFQGPGPDEIFYKSYVEMIERDGLLSYPRLVGEYIEHQKKTETQLILPPLRVAFITSALAWKQLTGGTALEATHAIACAASIATLIVAGMFAWRLGGVPAGLGVFALMAFAPMQIYMAQRGLIDGFFSLWALLAVWALWENLQQPRHAGWLCLYGLAIAAMVTTKENAFFVYVALWSLLLSSRYLKFGRPTWAVFAVTIAAPALAMIVLLLAAGGLSELIEVYRTNMQKSVVSPYAIKTGDGPWHRYLVDLLLVDPFILLLAIGAVFSLRAANKPAIYLSLFVGVTYLIMCQVRYGMNLRYTNIWDMPLRWLAFSLLLALTSSLGGRKQIIVVSGIVAGLCLLQWQQYHLFFVEAGIYDPVPASLGNALDILK